MINWNIRPTDSRPLLLGRRRARQTTLCHFTSREDVEEKRRFSKRSLNLLNLCTLFIYFHTKLYIQFERFFQPATCSWSILRLERDRLNFVTRSAPQEWMGLLTLSNIFKSRGLVKCEWDVLFFSQNHWGRWSTPLWPSPRSTWHQSHPEYQVTDWKPWRETHIML